MLYIIVRFIISVRLEPVYFQHLIAYSKLIFSFLNFLDFKNTQIGKIPDLRAISRTSFAALNKGLKRLTNSAFEQQGINYERKERNPRREREHSTQYNVERYDQNGRKMLYLRHLCAMLSLRHALATGTQYPFVENILCCGLI